MTMRLAESEPPPAPSPEDVEELSTRERILQEATRLFAERGWAATTLREVAAAAGCTKPALYYHFGNKEQLFLAAIRHETELLSAIFEEIERPGRPVRERLVDGLRLFFRHVERAPTGMALLMRAELRPEPDQPDFDFDSLRSHHHQHMRELLELGVQQREIRAELDLDDAAYALSGMVDQRLQLWLHGTPLPPDLPQRLVALFFEGARPR